MPGEDLNVLIAEETKKAITIKGRDFLIGKLSIKQVVKLTNFIATAIGKGVNVKDKLNNNTFASAFLLIFESITDNEIADFVANLLNTDDLEFIKENVDAEMTTEIIALVCEQNDFGKIWSNLQRAINAVKVKVPTTP